MLAGEPPLDVAVELEAALRVDHEQLAGAEPAAQHRLSGRRVEDADLGSAADEIARDDVAQRAQAVAVERGADDSAVAEDDAGRAVPRLAEAGVEAVEVADVVGQLGIVLPGGRHEHRERVPDVPAALHEQLERVVEHPGVGARLVEQRAGQGRRRSSRPGPASS